MEPRRNLEARGTSDGTHRKSYLHTFPCKCMYFDDTCAYPMSDCRTHTSSACMSACTLDCICACLIVGTSMHSTTGALSLQPRSELNVIVPRIRDKFEDALGGYE